MLLRAGQLLSKLADNIADYVRYQVGLSLGVSLGVSPDSSLAMSTLVCVRACAGVHRAGGGMIAAAC